MNQQELPGARDDGLDGPTVTPVPAPLMISSLASLLSAPLAQEQRCSY